MRTTSSSSSDILGVMSRYPWQPGSPSDQDRVRSSNPYGPDHGRADSPCRCRSSPVGTATMRSPGKPLETAYWKTLGRTPEPLDRRQDQRTDGNRPTAPADL